MLKQKISLLILISLVFSSFSGCRIKEEEEPTADYSGITLTYYKVFDDSDIMEPMITQYEADHPGLDIVYKKFSDFDEYQKTILNEMAEGKGPDIFSMQNTWFAPNIGKISPLPKDFGTPSDFSDTFVNVAYDDMVLVDGDGKEQVYALPMTVDTLALYYNKAQFEDRLPEQGKPSSTWEGIKDDVTKLKKEDNSFSRFEVAGIAMGRSDNVTRAVDILYLLFLQNGGSFYNDNASQAIFAGKQGNDGSTTYPMLEALDFYTSFADEDQKYYTWNEFTAEDDSDGKEIAAFATGAVSMIIGYAYTYDEILNQINLQSGNGAKTIDDDDIGVTYIPQIYDPDISKEERVTYASYFAETVSKNSEHPDIAWDFLIFLTSQENLDYYFEKTNKPTSRRDMIEDQKQDPIFGVFADQIGHGVSFPMKEYYTYKEIFADIISQANSDVVTRGDIVDAQDAITEMLPEEGFYNPIDTSDNEDDEEADVESDE